MLVPAVLVKDALQTQIKQDVICWKCGLGEMVYHTPFST